MKKIKFTLLLFTATVLTVSAKNSYNTDTTAKKLTLDIEYLQSQSNDTLTLSVGNKLTAVATFVTKADIYYATKNKKGLYHFEVPVKTEMGYFVISAQKKSYYKVGKDNNMIIAQPQFWENGDRIKMQIDHKETSAGIYSKCSFSGQGSEKYTVNYAIEQVEEKENDPAFDGNILKYAAVGKRSYLDQPAKLALLEQYRPKLNELAYNVIKANICFRDNSFSLIRDYYRKLQEANEQDSALQFRNAFKSYYGDKQYSISKRGLENSTYYLNYAFRKTKCMAMLEDTLHYSDRLFDLIVNNYDGEIRAGLLLWYFRNEPTSINNQKQFLVSRKLFEGTPFDDSLASLAVALPGRLLKNYQLVDVNGRTVDLDQYKNKVVLIDFWFTGCGGCKSYFKNTLSKAEERFKDNPGVVFISVSIDYDAKKWKAGVISGEYTSPHAVNLNTNKLGFKHPIILDNNVYQYPTKMLLAKGLKLHLYDSEVLNDFESLQQEIKSLLK